tara:strand:+ start:2038 stop:2700 length:663 start_codon:yes stop_codon:yes gene_type:complete
MVLEQSVKWSVSNGFTNYKDATETMEQNVTDIRSGAPGKIWLVEHPSIYTAGTRARPRDLLNKNVLPVFKTGRGGEYTYHGPGQRVVYVMLDLNFRGRDVKQFVHDLEEWVILSLRHFGILGERRLGRVGVWVEQPGYNQFKNTEAKIAAIGIRLRHWISYHGISININPDLSHYDGIIPCGISEYGITSFANLGVSATMADVDKVLKASFTQVFGYQTT